MARTAPSTSVDRWAIGRLMGPGSPVSPIAFMSFRAQGQEQSIAFQHVEGGPTKFHLYADLTGGISRFVWSPDSRYLALEVKAEPTLMQPSNEALPGSEIMLLDVQ